MDKVAFDFSKIKRSTDKKDDKKEPKSYERELLIFLKEYHIKSKKDIDPAKELVFMFRLATKHEVHIYRSTSYEELLKLWNDYYENTSNYGNIYSIKFSVDEALAECRKNRGPIRTYTVEDVNETVKENGED